MVAPMLAFIMVESGQRPKQLGLLVCYTHKNNDETSGSNDPFSPSAVDSHGEGPDPPREEKLHEDSS
jgi:hypothetical protein